MTTPIIYFLLIEVAFPQAPEAGMTTDIHKQPNSAQVRLLFCQRYPISI